MSRTFAAATRRARRLMQPAGLRTLGGILKHLRSVQTTMLRAAPKPERAETSPRIPKGARFLARTHHSRAGSRAYKLYMPASHPVRPKGLILMLHGCNQTPDDFARGTHMNTEAERHGLAVVYPAQTLRHNAGGCWNWFRPGDQTRGAGEPALLASLVRKLAKDFGLDRSSVFVAGLSAGGAMAAILVDVYPDLFSAAGVHSGLARGAATGMLSAVTAMRSGGPRPQATVGSPLALVRAPVRRIVFQGDADDTVHVSNAAMIVSAALGEGAVTGQVTRRSVRGRAYARSDFTGADGRIVLQLWMLHGAGHAWSGGRASGSYVDVTGPDASALMVRFFLDRTGGAGIRDRARV